MTTLILINLLLNMIQTVIAIATNNKMMTPMVNLCMVLLVSWSLCLLLVPIGIKGLVIYLMTHLGLYLGVVGLALHNDETPLGVLLFYVGLIIAHIYFLIAV